MKSGTLHSIKQELTEIKEGAFVHTEFTQVQMVAKCLSELIDYLLEKSRFD
jgi:phage antirepressor YoqD-like protein